MVENNEQFLSRLCGGEVTLLNASLLRLFLSRLCGGEDIKTLLTQWGRFSKPPMWR